MNGRPRRSAARRALRGLAGLLALLVVTLVVVCLVPVAPTVARQPAASADRLWQLSRGHRLAFEHVPAAGGPRRTPVLFVHGGPGGYVHSSVVRTLGRLAERGHDVWFYEQVGSGRSDRLARPGDYGFLGHVEDLREVVERFLGGRVVLVGQSYGALLAAELVARHPALVERLVLTSPGTLQPMRFDDRGWITERELQPPPEYRFVPPAQVAMDGVRFWPPRALASMALATALDVKLMPDREADGVLDTLAARFTSGMVCDPRHVQPEEGGAGFYAHGRSNWFGDHEDPRPSLRARTLPVLVLQGACDHLEYATAYEYVTLFPNARYRFIEGAGHIIWWEQPDAWLAAIEAFLEEPLGAGSPREVR